MVPDQKLLFDVDRLRRLRWFPLPCEAKALLLNTSDENISCPTPFAAQKIIINPDVIEQAIGSYYGSSQFELKGKTEQILTEGRRKVNHYKHFQEAIRNKTNGFYEPNDAQQDQKDKRSNSLWKYFPFAKYCDPKKESYTLNSMKLSQSKFRLL